MSLVDYASSDEDEAEVKEEEEKKGSREIPKHEAGVPKDDPPLPQSRRSGLSSYQQVRGFSHSSDPPAVKLPDASLLLNSSAMSSHLVSGYDHSSRVAAAMAESASRKRDVNGLASAFPRRKVPKGTVPHSRSVPDTARGLLVPPQVGGRSNVVTEDIGKLFVKKQAEPSSN